MRGVPVALLVLWLTGCSGLMDAMAPVAQGAQWLGTVVDVADAGADAYFARHPHIEHATRVDAAVIRARGALAALNAALAVAEAADDGDVQTARAEALRAYGELRDLLGEFGVLTAAPPPGGAETDAPRPEPLQLPTMTDLGAVL